MERKRSVQLHTVFSTINAKINKRQESCIKMFRTIRCKCMLVTKMYHSHDLCHIKKKALLQRGHVVGENFSRHGVLSVGRQAKVGQSLTVIVTTYIVIFFVNHKSPNWLFYTVK